LESSRSKHPNGSLVLGENAAKKIRLRPGLMMGESWFMPRVSLRVNPRRNRKTNRSIESDAPLRAELFNLEQLKRHAQVIAAGQQLVSGGGANRLLKRLEHNEKILRDFNHATLAVNQSRRVTPAADWLLDNFYLIEEQIQMARRHLPPGYSRELPRLASGPFAGWLRVSVLVFELISHVDAQVDLELLAAFVEAYQKVAPLTLGELWAIPIMLRLA
jgi:cyclic beta-1,2-glucan synthetase